MNRDAVGRVGKIMKNTWVAVVFAAVSLAGVGLVAGCDGGEDGGINDIAVGAQAPHGSPLDMGSEVPVPDSVKAFWGDQAPRMRIMCQANSFKLIEGDRTDAYCPEIVAETGALKMRVNSDGTVTATAKDFVSKRSGLVWKFQGYTIQGEENPVLRQNPLVLQPEDQIDTFRGYWNSYLPAN